MPDTAPPPITQRQDLEPFPVMQQAGFDSVPFRLWFHRLAIRVREKGQILWDQLDFTGSDLSDIESRRHNDLTDIQGGATNDNFHWTADEKDFTQTMDWLVIDG